MHRTPEPDRAIPRHCPVMACHPTPRFAGRRPLGTPAKEENIMLRTKHHDFQEATTRATRHALDQRQSSQLDISHPLTEGSTAGPQDAAVPKVEIPQYRPRAILAVWAAAALPMAALAWLVAPAIAERLSGEGNLPMVKALTVCLMVGLIWQFVLVMALVHHEQRSLRWSTLREALWLRSPRSPRSGRIGGRIWLVLIPLVLAFALVNLLIPTFGLQTA